MEDFGTEYCLQLIAKVENYEHLFNTKNPNHGNRAICDQSWKQISEELEKPVEVCRKVWRLLRNQYARVLRTNNRKIFLSGMEPKKPWQFEKRLEFLKPFLTTTRRTSYDFSVNSETLFCTANVSGYEEGEVAEGDNNGSLLVGVEEFSEISSDSSQNMDIEHKISTSQPPLLIKPVSYATMHEAAKPIPIKRKAADADTVADASTLDNSEGDLYFKALACRYKTFTPMQQALCRVEMDKVMFNIEFGNGVSVQHNELALHWN